MIDSPGTPPSAKARWRAAVRKVLQQRGECANARSPADARAQANDGHFFEVLSDFLKRHEQKGQFRSMSSSSSEDETEDVSLPLIKNNDARTDLKRKLLSDILDSNKDKLYVKILNMMLHTVGQDINAVSDRDGLFSYLQSVFEFDDRTHKALLKEAKYKEVPKMNLNIEVLEAKDLASMDANGLSDTFCTLYLTSSREKQCTTVKLRTLCPQWHEHFCLPVKDALRDTLYVEGWDFDPAETIHEKVTKVTDIKGMKGWMKLVREFGHIGKNENQLIGVANIPLKDICSSGEIRWCDFKKVHHTEKRGSVKLRLSYSSLENTVAAFKDHQYLLRLLLFYELEAIQNEPYSWNGDFPDISEIILTQHLVQSGIPLFMGRLLKWIEYTNFHACTPISFEAFPPLLLKLLPALQNEYFDKDKAVLFWEATRTLMPSCFEVIKSLNTLTPNKKITAELSAILRIISLLKHIEPPHIFELFPSSLYDWVPTLQEKHKCDVMTITKCTIVHGTEEWYKVIMSSLHEQNSTKEAKLNKVIDIVKLAKKYLMKAIDNYDNMFQENDMFLYSPIVYSIHEYKISKLVKPVVEDINNVIKPLYLEGKISEVDEDDALSLGMKLFDLYLTLQKIVEIGYKTCHDEKEQALSQYYVWFHESVTHWLDIATWKSLRRIKKAVDLDEFISVSDSVQHSSSAVDTLCIYNQIKIFWHQLSWPNVEGSYAFVARIIDDICRCSLYYADTIIQKIVNINESMKNAEHNFEVSKAWCLAINNIEFICHSIQPLVDDLGTTNILEKLDSTASNLGSEKCRKSIKSLVDNTLENVQTKVWNLLERTADLMNPAISNWLWKGQEEYHKGEHYRNLLLEYLDNNMITLSSNLKSVLFQKILQLIWKNVITTLFNILEQSFQKRRHRSYYCHLNETVEILTNFFGGEEEAEEISNIKAIKDLRDKLIFYCMETSELIHNYYLERVEEQRLLQNSPYGIITISAQFIENVLRIQVLNCRKLPAMDKNGSSDPYVEITLLPLERFIGIKKKRTKTHKKTIFPLFDESFTFVLSPNGKQEKNGMVLFSVKDQDIIGNDFIGEAYLCFSEIDTAIQEDHPALKQLHLNISRPKNLESGVSKALKNRLDDKVAKEFIKKEILKAKSQ